MTDAAVLLGFIDPSGYLDGRVPLDRERARIALEKTFGKAGGWSTEDAARGVIELTATNMAHALRSVTVERGHDPREFLMVAYGGMLPLFVTSICDKLGVDHAIVPQNSSAFSAMGTLLSDYVRRYSMTVGWDMHDGSGFQAVQQRRDDLRAIALADAAAEGLEHDDTRLDWGAECRFTGQVYEVEMPLDAAPFHGASAHEFSNQFREHYERMYGKGTAWPDASVTLLNLTLTISGVREKPALPESSEGESEAVIAAHRQVWLGVGSGPVKIPVHRDEDLHPGAVIAGPAIVDQHDSTLWVAEGWSARRDRWFSFVLSREAPPLGAGSWVDDE